MMRGGSKHSGFGIASTFVISREKNSYADVVHYIKEEDFIHGCRSCVHSCNHDALTCFLKLLLLLYSHRTVDSFPTPLPRRHMLMYDGLQVYISDLVHTPSIHC